MPKRLKKQAPRRINTLAELETAHKTARPGDVNQLARYLVDITVDPPDPPRLKVKEVTKSEMSRVMSALGRRGGRVGGKRRLETMTPEQRSAVALKAARARWSKRGKKKL
jgi:hypothetical protein